jgi:hypothetical protein
MGAGDSNASEESYACPLCPLPKNTGEHKSIWLVGNKSNVVG